MWCYIRARHIRKVADQAIITPRAAAILTTTSTVPSSKVWQPPSWINNANTLRFFLALGTCRIPGECQFITLSTDAAVVVEVDDVVASALPELCEGRSLLSNTKKKRSDHDTRAS